MAKTLLVARCEYSFLYVFLSFFSFIPFREKVHSRRDSERKTFAMETKHEKEKSGPATSTRCDDLIVALMKNCQLLFCLIFFFFCFFFAFFSVFCAYSVHCISSSTWKTLFLARKIEEWANKEFPTWERPEIETKRNCLFSFSLSKALFSKLNCCSNSQRERSAKKVERKKQRRKHFGQKKTRKEIVLFAFVTHSVLCRSLLAFVSIFPFLFRRSVCRDTIWTFLCTEQIYSHLNCVSMTTIARMFGCIQNRQAKEK